MFEGTIINVALKRLTDGDSGSTLLGSLAGALLAAHINFGDLFSKDPQKKAQTIGLVIGTIILFVWGYFTGKSPKQSVSSVPENPPAAG